MFINGKYHKIFEIKTKTSGSSFLNNSNTYSSLPAPTTVAGKYYYVLSSQGTKWLPWSLGGTYYPNGLYYSDGTNWIFSESPSQASQSDVNAGVSNDQFVSPATLNNYSGWTASKVGLNFVDEETPLGSINNVNTVFSMQFTPTTNSLHVFLNGMRLKNTEDFTYTGTVLTMINIPYTGDKLIINYRY